MNNKTAGTILVFVLLIGGLFWWYQSGAPESIIPPSEEAGVGPQTLLAELARIENLTLNTSILRDPIFISLIRYEVSTTSQGTIGRKNPFLPF